MPAAFEDEVERLRDAPDDRGAVRRRAALISAHLARLFEQLFGDASGACLVATGGLGRGELAPDSDLDLCVFRPQPDPATREATGAFVRALWETGKEAAVLSHDLESLEQTLRSDLAGTTALLEGRLLCGDWGAWQTLRAQLRERFLPELGGLYIRCKIQEIEEREQRALEVSEPDLKEGVGGQREAQLAALMLALEAPSDEDPERVLAGLAKDAPTTRAALARLGGVTPEEWAAALGLLDASRAGMGRLSGQRRLIKAWQRDLARELGYRDSEQVRGVDAFMTELLHARRLIHQVCGAAMRRAKARLGLEPAPQRRTLASSGVLAHGDLLELQEGEAPESPAEVLALFALMQRSKRGLGEATRARLRTELLPALAEAAWEEASEPLLTLLARPIDVAETLRTMHEVGLLGRVLPEFRFVDGRAHFDELQAWSFDEQALRALAVLEGRGPERDRREARVRYEMVLETERRELLRLALLLADVAKGTGLGIAQRDQDVFPELARRLGLGPFELSHLQTLVRERGTFARLAERRKLREASTVEALLEAVDRQPLRLEHLYLLSCARGSALREEGLPAWEDHLLTQLYEAARDALEAPEARGAGRLEALLEAAPFERRGRLRAHLELCPSGYLVESDAIDVQEELALIEALPREGLTVRLLADEEVRRVTIAARMWSHRFVTQTGCLAALSLSVLDATAWARSDGVTLDRFVTRDLLDRPPELVERALGAMLERARRGELDVAAKVREASRAQPRLGRGPQLAPPPAKVRVHERDGQTIVEVIARDRLGLLYEVARTFSRLDVLVQFAKIVTRGAQAIDSFYVSRGGAPLSEDAAAELARALREALAD